MVGKKNIRSYEVSIWTLQDSFIAVLKPLNLEHKGAIQDGKITLQDDGENRISFSIPMYIREKGEFIENPLWYDTENGNLIANLRKLKVIFNKKTADERVFEFIITKVTENHEGFEKTCEVEGESLAFNELGKQGYKISLSEEDLYNEVSDELDALKADDSTEEISVKNKINYWIDKVLAGTNWSYSIQMDWSIVDGIIDQYEEGATRYSDLTEEQRATLNSNRESNGLRRHDRIYEDAYVSSWSISNNALIPAAVVESAEKLRMVEGNESNRYNLLQSIAEAFEVYTKYKYYYDKNYHIIGREVIFYNNFLDENNTIDLTYDYDTQSISRELDAADIVTKMYVKTLDDESYPSGLASIMDTEANKTGEDYILNFDYLYDIKTISDEQYAAIKTFEKDIANLNKQIKPLDTSIIKLEEELLDAEIARDNALALMKEAKENITFITDQLKAITNDSNYSATVTVVKENPAFIFLSKQESNYLGKFGSQFSGIVPGTVKVYSDQACTSEVSFTQQIKDNMVQSLTFTNSTGTNITSGYLYATFDYKPALEKEKLKENYEILCNNHQRIYNNNLTLIEGTNPTKINGTKKELGLTNYIKAQKQKRQLLYEQKQALIADFENMMGSALREGNWQPEDEYVGYGDQYDENIQPSYSSSAISTTSGKLKFIWDKELFDEEEKNYYEYGINQEKVYYPCIDLTAINSNIFDKLKEEDFRNGLSFVYKNSGESNPYLLPQGVNCKFAFIQSTSGGNIVPVLMITNLYNETNIANDTTANIALGYLKSLTSYIAYTTDISILLNTITANNSTIFSVPSSAWIEQPHKYNIVYPRLEIQSDLLKTGTNELLLHIYREKADPTDSTGERKVYTYIDKLKEFTDYSIFSRNEKKYITIKPEVLLAGKIGEAKIKINYCLANTALQIYLDAIEVMKENAYPKVSYTISQLFSPKLFYNTYDRLGQLAHINDAKLKFKNVMGYISAVELNLDKPWEDNITIQNYKNKFEDLFSTIVAQTEDMKKNAYRINAAANAFSANGLLTAEVTPESLLKSARVLNNLIKQNADVIAAKAISEAAKNKAALASTDAYRIMHGEVGLAFKGNKIDSVVLNQDKGLIIAGKTGTTNVFFQLDNAEMGFFKGIPGTFNETNPAARPVPQLYYENGNLTLSGVMYAANGWFGDERGWIIGSGLTNSNSGKLVYKDSSGTNVTATISNDDLGGLLYSANGKAIFTSGSNSTNPKIILSKNGFPDITKDEGKNDALFLFDGTNLYINGTITSTAGNIGGWHIGDNYLGNGTSRKGGSNPSTVGMSCLEEDTAFAFWAGGQLADGNDPIADIPFYVRKNGTLSASKGYIGGWKIDSNSIYYGTKGNSNEDNDITLMSSSTFARTINTIERSNLKFAIGKYFGVDNTGKLYAHDAIISGDITARSGTIGASDATQITIGNVTTNSTKYAAIYNGVTSISDIAHNGFYLGANGIVLGKGVFKVTSAGKLTAAGVEIDGNIRATEGRIGGTLSNNSWTGGWIIKSDAIYNGPSSFGASTVGLYLGTDGISGYTDPTHYFKFNKGTISATGATISGALTATSLSTGSRTSSTAANGTYINSDGAIYGGQNKFTVSKEGAVTATSITIGSTSGTYLTYDSTNGLKIKGNITATSGTFTGTINARSGTIGEEKAPQIRIGSSGNTSTSISRIYSSTKSTLDSDTIDGFYLGTNGLALGKGLFKVTDAGVLTAKSGTIGGWTIGSNYIGTGTTRGNSAVGMSNYTTGSDDDGKLVFWAGNPNTTGTGIGLTTSDIPFSVTRAGVLRASKVNITGGEFSINCSKDFQIYNPDTDKYDITWAYRGKVSINKNFKVAEDDLYADSPCPLYIEENFNNNKSYTYLWNGQLRFASKKNGSYNTMISNDSIETPLIYTYYKGSGADSNSSGSIDLHGNFIEIMDNSDTSGSTSNIIKMTANKNNVGLSVTMKTDNDFYSQEKWLIRKNKNGEIYIDGIVHVKNSNGDWIEISG